MEYHSSLLILYFCIGVGYQIIEEMCECLHCFSVSFYCVEVRSSSSMKLFLSNAIMYYISVLINCCTWVLSDAGRILMASLGSLYYILHCRLVQFNFTAILMVFD